jgi:glutamate--cysteine ligase
MEMSRRHQQTLREESLAPDRVADFERMSRESLAEQKAIEAGSTQPFAQFLEEYLRS